MRLGVRLPSTGPAAAHGVADGARRIEESGWDSLWVTDHVVMTEQADRSTYPFSDDGIIGWDRHAPVHDAVVLMAQAAAATDRIEIGSAVLVVALRHPVVLAKQLASLDDLSGGRIVLGAGVGWYREEYEALGVDFDRRGAIFDEWLEVMRSCWTGSPDAYAGDHVALPAGVIARPVPQRRIPLLVGGVSPIALRRAVSQGDGWLGLQRAGRLDVVEVAGHVTKLGEAATRAGFSGRPRVTLRIIESADRIPKIATVLGTLADVGVDEVIVDVDWADPEGLATAHDRLRAATNG